MNVKKFRLKGETTPVLEQVKPMLERVANNYPGSEDAMNAVFDKPWIVVDAEFKPRSRGEKKVISFTDEAIFVSLPWLKGATSETIKQAFVHESMRSLSKEIIRGIENQQENVWHGSKGKFDRAFLEKQEDAITEALTPVVFQKMPYAYLESKVDASLKPFCDKILQDANRNAGGMVSRFFGNKDWVRTAICPRLLSRNAVSRDYTKNKVNAWKLHRDFCHQGVDAQTIKVNFESYLFSNNEYSHARTGHKRDLGFEIPRLLGERAGGELRESGVADEKRSPAFGNPTHDYYDVLPKNYLEDVQLYLAAILDEVRLAPREYFGPGNNDFQVCTLVKEDKIHGPKLEAILKGLANTGAVEL